MIFSHSRLSCFEQCPLKFRYKYIDKVKTETEETIEAFLGKRVHESLEKIYRDLKLENLRSLDEILEFFNSKWEKNWDENKIIVNGKIGIEERKNMGERFLSGYYNRHSPFNNSRTIGLEMPIKLDLNGDGKFRIRGFVDRLSLAGNTVEIHDYKTGSRLPAQEHLAQDRQLALYAMAAKKMLPFANEINLVWHFLAFDREIRIVPDEKHLEQVKRNTINLIEKINSEKEFPAIESRLCSWCEFQQVCKKPEGGNLQEYIKLPAQ